MSPPPAQELAQELAQDLARAELAAADAELPTRPGGCVMRFWYGCDCQGEDACRTC